MANVTGGLRKDDTMKKATSLAILLAAGLSATFLGGCVATAPPDAVYVDGAPPAAQVEVIGVAPGPDFVWIRGYHRWSGNSYVWAPGRWERRPRAGAVWVDGRWRHARRGWFWTNGHWR
jgi:hypothetical protein